MPRNPTTAITKGDSTIEVLNSEIEQSEQANATTAAKIRALRQTEALEVTLPRNLRHERVQLVVGGADERQWVLEARSDTRYGLQTIAYAWHTEDGSLYFRTLEGWDYEFRRRSYDDDRWNDEQAALAEADEFARRDDDDDALKQELLTAMERVVKFLEDTWEERVDSGRAQLPSEYLLAELKRLVEFERRPEHGS